MGELVLVPVARGALVRGRPARHRRAQVPLGGGVSQVYGDDMEQEVRPGFDGLDQGLGDETANSLGCGRWCAGARNKRCRDKQMGRPLPSRAASGVVSLESISTKGLIEPFRILYPPSCIFYPPLFPPYPPLPSPAFGY